MELKQLRFSFMKEKLSLADLEKAVEKYLDSHIYEGYCAPFKLSQLSLEGTLDNGRHCFLVKFKGDYEDDIENNDNKWESGLTRLGNDCGVSLRLPLWYYRK